LGQPIGTVSPLLDLDQPQTQFFEVSSWAAFVTADDAEAA
jgi:hypothetical protein